jgi:hypothetical protein
MGVFSMRISVYRGQVQKMNKNWKSLAVAGLLIISLALIWMHRFQYEHVGVALVRINRFTGKGCYFVEGKWDSRSAGDPLSKSSGYVSPFSPSEDKSGLDGLMYGKSNLCE